MFLRPLRLGMVALALTSAAAALGHAAPATDLRVAVLGDLAPFRAIAADTLGFAAKGDVVAAQKRGTDLETAWDEAEDKLKATDPARWRVVDKAIDRVLAELRAAKPRQSGITAALQDLLATMDKGGAT